MSSVLCSGCSESHTAGRLSSVIETFWRVLGSPRLKEDNRIGTGRLSFSVSSQAFGALTLISETVVCVLGFLRILCLIMVVGREAWGKVEVVGEVWERWSSLSTSRGEGQGQSSDSGCPAL